MRLVKKSKVKFQRFPYSTVKRVGNINSRDENANNFSILNLLKNIGNIVNKGKTIIPNFCGALNS